MNLFIGSQIWNLKITVMDGIPTMTATLEGHELIEHEFPAVGALMDYVGPGGCKVKGFLDGSVLVIEERL